MKPLLPAAILLLGSPQNFTTAVIAQGQAAMQCNAREH